MLQTLGQMLKKKKVETLNKIAKSLKKKKERKDSLPEFQGNIRSFPPSSVTSPP